MSKKRNTCEKIAESVLQQEKSEEQDSNLHIYGRSAVPSNSTSLQHQSLPHQTTEELHTDSITGIPLLFSGKNRVPVDLKVMPRNDKDVPFLENAMITVGRSFAGTMEVDPEPFAHWLLGPQLSELDPHVVQNENDMVLMGERKENIILAPPVSSNKQQDTNIHQIDPIDESQILQDESQIQDGIVIKIENNSKVERTRTVSRNELFQEGLQQNQKGESSESIRLKISKIVLGFHIGLSGIYPKESFVIGARIRNFSQNDNNQTNIILHNQSNTSSSSQQALLPNQESTTSDIRWRRLLRSMTDLDLPQDGLVIARYYPNGPIKNICETTCWPMCLAIKESKLIGSHFSKSPFKDYWPKIEKRLKMIPEIFYNWKKKYFCKNNNTTHNIKKGKSLPFIYVAANAVLPECQGKGVGSRQMKVISYVADKLNIHCWLECGGEKNIAIYKRLGYKVVEKVDALHMVDDPEDWVLDYVGMIRNRKSDRAGIMS